MSLMLDVLKRIEAKQRPARGREAAEPIASPSAASPVEQIVPPSVAWPPALPADVLPSMPPEEDFAPPELGSLEVAMDRLQAFVAEAGLLYDAELEFDTSKDAEPELDASKEAQPALDTTKNTEPTLDAGKETEPALDAGKDTEPAIDTNGDAEPALDAGKDTEPALDTNEDTESEVDAAKDTGPEFGANEDAEPEVEAGEAEADLPVITPVASEPYAATAQQILRQLRESCSQTLLFTSPADGQGKTTTLARLAPLLAHGIEGNVLVVDANFRNPDMARCLAVAPTWRLPDVLAGAADWATAVQTTAYERVSLLPGGTDIRGPAIMGTRCPRLPRGLGQDVHGLSQLLHDLAGHYDLVVVDAASLAHRGTAQLAAVCDATYLVVRLGEGSPRIVREAARVLQRNGARLLGCVAIDGG